MRGLRAGYLANSPGRPLFKKQRTPDDNTPASTEEHSRGCFYLLTFFHLSSFEVPRISPKEWGCQPPRALDAGLLLNRPLSPQAGWRRVGTVKASQPGEGDASRLSRSPGKLFAKPYQLSASARPAGIPSFHPGLFQGRADTGEARSWPYREPRIFPQTDGRR